MDRPFLIAALKRGLCKKETMMIPIFLKRDRRQGNERRRDYLTIQFADRRSGRDRRIAIDRRSAMFTHRKNGAERRAYSKAIDWNDSWLTVCKQQRTVWLYVVERRLRTVSVIGPWHDLNVGIAYALSSMQCTITFLMQFMGWRGSMVGPVLFNEAV